MTEMTLREVCQEIGVSRRAVQGYEKANLVSATGKNNRGHLLYNDIAQKRIRQIKLFQDMGFSIKEIQIIIDGSSHILRPALIEQEKKLNENIAHNHAMISIIQEMLKTL